MKKYPVYGVKNFSIKLDDSQLYVNSLENHLVLHGFVHSAHRHDSYLMVYFTQGIGEHTIDFEKFEIKQGSLFLLQPGQMHHWTLSEDIKGYIVLFSKEIYQLYFGHKKASDFQFYSSPSTNPHLFFETIEETSLLFYYDLLLKESQNKKMFKIEMMTNLLDCIHIVIARKYSEVSPSIKTLHNTKIAGFEILVEEHFKFQKRPSFYAGELNISLKHLNRLSMEILKKRATEVILDRVVLEIKRMLVDQNLSINEIAIDMGFEDYSYFSRFFKKHVQLSPTAFRAVANERKLV